MLYFGGGGTFSFESAFKPFIKDAVQDKVRVEQIIDLTKEADEQTKQFRKEVKDVWVVELKALVTDYNTNEDDLNTLVKRADGSRTAIQQKILDIRFKVRDLMTEDEWNSMRDAMDEKLEADRKKKEEKGK